MHKDKSTAYMCLFRQIAVQLLVAGAVTSCVGKEGSNGSRRSQFKEVTIPTNQPRGGWELERNEVKMECLWKGTHFNPNQLESTCKNSRQGGGELLKNEEEGMKMECRWNSPEGEEEREDISSPTVDLLAHYNCNCSSVRCQQRQRLQTQRLQQLSKLTQAQCQRMCFSVSHHCV